MRDLWEDVRIVAGREIREKLRDRSFLVFTAFLLLTPFALGAFTALLGASTMVQERNVGLVGEGSERLGPIIEKEAQTFGARVELEEFPNAGAAERAVRGGEVDAAVVGGRILTQGGLGFELETLLQSSAQRAGASEMLREAGVPAQEVEEAVGAALDPAPLAVEDLGAGGGFDARWPAAAVGLILLFVTVFTYGYWIANGVVEEKSSRVVEVVLSAVKPSRLLAGKVIGIGLLGLGQLLLLALIFGLFAAPLLGSSLPPSALGLVGAVLLWFVLGFAFYGCVCAIAGAVVSRHEDLQYTQAPIMLLFFAGYGLSFFALSAPDSPVVWALSFFPPFAPMLMLVRIALGEAGAAEVVLAVFVTAAATAGLVALAARIYGGSALRFGARVPLREAWRSAGSR